MPSQSKNQWKFIYAKRGEYKTKKDTPDKWLWIWDSKWFNNVDYSSLPNKKESILSSNSIKELELLFYTERY